MKNKIKDCSCMSYLHNFKNDNSGSIYCKVNEYLKIDQISKCELHLIGVNQKNGNITFICGYEWNIIEINSSGNFEKIGKLIKTNLSNVKENPGIILNNAKVMTLKELEEKLGHSIILSDYTGG